MNIQQIMKQAQQMQKKMLQEQEEMAKRQFEGTSGGGMVTALVSGLGALISIKLDPEVVSKDDIEMLQDLIVAAVNDAHRKAGETGQGGMAEMMGKMGLKLPGM